MAAVIYILYIKDSTKGRNNNCKLPPSSNANCKINLFVCSFALNRPMYLCITQPMFSFGIRQKIPLSYLNALLGWILGFKTYFFALKGGTEGF